MEMPNQVSNKNWWLNLFTTAIFLATSSGYNPALFSQSSAKTNENFPIRFEDKLAFYLNQKTKSCLNDLVVKEKLLVQMIKNITQELRSRDRSAVMAQRIEIEEIFGNPARLTAEYSTEIDNLINILNETNQLRNVVEGREDQALERLANLRAQVLTEIEGRRLDEVSSHRRGGFKMLVTYKVELDSLLAMYERLDALQGRAEALGDPELAERIAAPMDSLRAVLGAAHSPIPDSFVNAYLNEAQLLFGVLDELSKLRPGAMLTNSAVSFEAAETRRAILANLDKRFLTVMGYSANLNEVMISDIVDEWKGQQYADYKLHFERYHLIKRSLLESAAPAERSRMLKLDLSSAFMNYLQGNYDLAERQFTLLLSDYGEQFADFAAVVFYRGESLFGRRLYKQFNHLGIFWRCALAITHGHASPGIQKRILPILRHPAICTPKVWSPRPTKNADTLPGTCT